MVCKAGSRQSPVGARRPDQPPSTLRGKSPLLDYPRVTARDVAGPVSVFDPRRTDLSSPGRSRGSENRLSGSEYSEISRDPRDALPWPRGHTGVGGRRPSPEATAVGSLAPPIRAKQQRADRRRRRSHLILSRHLRSSARDARFAWEAGTRACNLSGHLARQPLLDLQLTGEELDDPGELRETDDRLRPAGRRRW